MTINSINWQWILSLCLGGSLSMQASAQADLASEKPCMELFFSADALGFANNEEYPGVMKTEAQKKKNEDKCSRFGLWIGQGESKKVLYSPLVDFTMPGTKCDGDESALSDINAKLPAWCGHTGAWDPKRRDEWKDYVLPQLDLNQIRPRPLLQREDALDFLKKELQRVYQTKEVREAQKVWRHGFSNHGNIGREPKPIKSTTLEWVVAEHSVLSPKSFVQVGWIQVDSETLGLTPEKCPIYGTQSEVAPLNVKGTDCEAVEKAIRELNTAIKDAKQIQKQFRFFLFDHSREAKFNHEASQIVLGTLVLTVEPSEFENPGTVESGQGTSQTKGKVTSNWVQVLRERVLSGLVFLFVLVLGAIGFLLFRQHSASKEKKRVGGKNAALPPNHSSLISPPVLDQNTAAISEQAKRKWLRFPEKFKEAVRELAAIPVEHTGRIGQWLESGFVFRPPQKDVFVFNPAMCKARDPAGAGALIDGYYSLLGLQKTDEDYTAQELFRAYLSPTVPGPMGGAQPQVQLNEAQLQVLPIYAQTLLVYVGESMPNAKWGHYDEPIGQSFSDPSQASTRSELELPAQDGGAESRIELEAYKTQVRGEDQKTRNRVVQLEAKIEELKGENERTTAALNRARQDAARSADECTKGLAEEARLRSGRNRALLKVATLEQEVGSIRRESRLQQTQLQSQLHTYQEKEKQEIERQQNILTRPPVIELQKRLDLVARLPVLSKSIERLQQALTRDEQGLGLFNQLKAGREQVEVLLAQARNHGGIPLGYLQEWEKRIETARRGEQTYLAFLQGVSGTGQLSKDAILRLVEHPSYTSADPKNPGGGFAAWAQVIRPPSAFPNDDGLELAKTFQREVVLEWLWPTIQMLKFTIEALPIEVPDLKEAIRVHPELRGMSDGSTLAVCKNLLTTLGFKWDPIPLYQHTTGDFLPYGDVRISGVAWESVGLGLPQPERGGAGMICRVALLRIIDSPDDCWYREAEIQAVQG